MKTTAIWRVCAAATALSAPSGLHPAGAQAVKDSSVTKTVKPSWDGFSLSMEPAQSQAKAQNVVEATESIGIHIVFRNTSPQERTLPLTSQLNRSSIILKNDKGESVPLTRYGQKHIGRPFIFADVTPNRLKAGEEYRYSFVLNRFFDMTESGTYFLTLKYNAPLYFGPKQSVPKSLMPTPEPNADRPEPLIREFKAPDPDIYAMPNPPYERERNGTTLIPAPENATDIPQIVSNTLTLKVNYAPTAWIHQGKPRRAD